MKIAIRYQSRGGNTRAIAEAIAKAAGVKAEPIDTPLTELVDLLFIGGGVYMWDIDKSLRGYLEGLNPDIVKSAAAFSTAGSMNGTGKIAAIIKSLGITVLDEALPMKVLTRNHAWLGGKGSITLSDKETKKIEDFVEKVTGLYRKRV